MFDIFGNYSRHTGTEVRIKLLENIASNVKFYEPRSVICLQTRQIKFTDWVTALANEEVYCDELALMGLCYMYHKHCLVLTQNKLWSTVQADLPMSLMDLLKICTVRLVYLGSLKFGVLTWRPRLPKKVATKSPGFNIVEEYTLNAPTIADAQNPSKTSSHAGTSDVQQPAKRSLTSRNVETDTIRSTQHATQKSPILATLASAPKDDESSQVVSGEGENVLGSLPKTSPKTKEENTHELVGVSGFTGETSLEPTKTESDPSTVKSVTPKYTEITADKDLHVEKSAVNITGESTHKLQPVTVHLMRLDPVEIDIWSNKITEFHVFKPTPIMNPVISDVKGYGLRSRPLKIKIEKMSSAPDEQPAETDETEVLLDQAQALINTAKGFVTKPVNCKHCRKHASTLPVGTESDAQALDVLHQVTMNKLTTVRVTLDGANQSSASTSIPPIKKRKIKCKMCDSTFDSVKELNFHHKQYHGIVQCEKCDKYFSTQSTLDKHMYVHREMKFNCELCGKCFPFASRLDQHMSVNINKKLPCPKKNCKKEFKSIGDVNRHVKMHTKGSWHHCDFCNYKNKDKRNTESHMRTHIAEEDFRYECDKCGKKMRFSTQYK